MAWVILIILIQIGLNPFKAKQKSIQRYRYLLHWVYYCAKTNSVNPLHFIIDKVCGYIEESDGNKYSPSAVVSTDKNKYTLEKYTKLWDEIKKTN